MKISIVMATYNGEAYLEPQLESVRKQTLPATEVIILDDASSDGTCQMIEDYIATYQLSHWRLLRNESNSGWKKNFIRGLSMAEGDYVFPCDQDDIWYEDKLARMVEEMERHPEILLLASSYDPLYEEGAAPLPKYITDQFRGTGAVEKVNFGKRLFYIERPGCVYAIRKNLLDAVKPLFVPSMAHDAVLWDLAMFADGLYLLDAPTIAFRRHANNASRKVFSKTERRQLLQRQEDVIVMLQKLLECEEAPWNRLSPEAVRDRGRFLHQAKKWCTLRKQWFADGKLFAYVKLVFYLRFYQSFRTYIGDFVLWFGA